MLELECTFGHGETHATITFCKFETKKHHKKNIYLCDTESKTTTKKKHEKYKKTKLDGMN